MPSATQPLCPVREEISPKDLKDLLDDIGTTPENLKRDAAVLREWTVSQPHLPDLTSEHDEWLETFLIVGKNSMEKAKTRLDNYFTVRTTLSDWFTMPPPPEDRNIIDESEYCINGWLPRVLPNGFIVYTERYVIPPSGNWSDIDMTAHFKRVVMMCDAITGLGIKWRGVVLLLDEGNVNLNMVTTFLGAIGGFRKAINCVQDCLPVRLHSIHLVNTVAPNLQRAILGAVTPLLKGKLAQRIRIHENMKSLHEYIPVEYLPERYGGTSPDIEPSSLSNFIAGNKDWFASREWMKTNEDRRVEKKVLGNDLGIEGSFRKLAVD